MTTPLQVSLGARSYPIHIGADILCDTALIAHAIPQRRVVVISNDTVWPLYGEALLAALVAENFSVQHLVLPDGEAHKDWSTLNRIFDMLLEHRCDRQTTLIALGGGVIGDIVGFAAASYQRGVPFIQMPTTLLAQVDSSVGGKTAINHPLGKNMIGAFYQPQLVLADTNVLRTLPDREYRSGLAEVIKYGIALDASFFEWCESNAQKLVARDAAVLAIAIRRSCEIKATIVAADERETNKQGGRALLNLGHTFGHAIESAMGYGVWLHGEAVGCGMALAAQLSLERGMLSTVECERTCNLIAVMGLRTTVPNVTADALLDHMGRDKKNEGGAIRLILLKNIGVAVVDSSVSSASIYKFLSGKL